jgi:hypothetical protein
MTASQELGDSVITIGQLTNDQTYKTWIPTSADGDIVGEPLAQRLREAEIKAARLEGWKKGVSESIDKLYAAAVSGVVGASDPNSIMLTVGRIIELLNTLIQHPPGEP